MKKIFLALVLSTQLTGCFYQTANQYDIQGAVKICGSLEKVVEINVQFNGAEDVECTDSSRHRMHYKGESK